MGHKSYDKRYLETQNNKFGDKFTDLVKETESDFDENNLSAKRFFVKDAHIGECTIFGDEHNHLANVMRLKAGDEVVLICDDEFDYFGKIREVKKNQTIVDVFDKAKNVANPKVNITAFVAMNKREHTSLIVRMLSELGVSTYVPIITKWTLRQDITGKMDRYQKIADQSVKQCRRSKTMKIEQPQKLDEVLKSFKDFDKVFFAYENESTQKMDEFLMKNITIKKGCFDEIEKQQDDKEDEKLASYLMKNNSKTNSKNIAFVVGPVAGFDKDEAKKIEDSGAVSVSLGKRILRADTATVMLASILSNYYLD